MPEGGVIVVAVAMPATMRTAELAPADTDGALIVPVVPVAKLVPSTGVAVSTPTYAAMMPVLPCADAIVKA
jgi:hypothetical protein